MKNTLPVLSKNSALSGMAEKAVLDMIPIDQKTLQKIIKIIESSAEDVKFVAIVLFQFLDKMKSVDMPLRECLITRYY